MIFPQQTIQCKGKLLNLATPQIMGIINMTPDSFYNASRKQNTQAALDTAKKMLHEGATILDIGGMSSRPGAEIISTQQELERVLPVIEAISKHHPDVIISIDTIHAEVAKKAITAGAAMVNDISAGKIDTEMYATVAELGVPYVLMHMRGGPKDMQQLTNYDDITNDILNFLIQEIHTLRTLGIKDIIIDPGFGFGKTIDQNYTLLQQLHIFKILNCPILAGLSRKSMIYKFLNIKPEEALNGTSVLHLAALQQGAKILRVHDVKAANEVVKLWTKVSSKEQ